MKKNIPYGHQWIDRSDIASVARILKSDWLTQGPMVEQFERAIAQYCGAKYAVAFSSGTAALHAAYKAAGIQAGDEVITTPLTFAATANGVVYCGGTPVFVDINEQTLNIDPQEIERKITKKTKAIAPVDFGGKPCEYKEILRIAKKHKLLVIEDASHALGAEYKGKRIGSIADMTIFSFHPVKLITTGEGGMVLTNSKTFYESLKIFRSHGIVKKPEQGGWYYEIEDLGYNYRLSDIQCALGVSQASKISRFVEGRRKIAAAYDRAFQDIKALILPKEGAGSKSAYHIYPIQVRTELLKVGRREIFDALKERRLGVQVHYIPVH
ncbi:MAG: UDP-4-amino-4,6-dideoxy-N-acetyl-beta-L-altrosamine transaminase, partial [Candidatus Yanofskybacteria bacterium]|nr:UDP-4-amino-4,6-dideoxy-N-acetyl-beta-L-altrosamine transaminase [Candidatus Yanofskybacteria bacterium]